MYHIRKGARKFDSNGVCKEQNMKNYQKVRIALIPFFNPIIVPEETTGSNCLKFGKGILFPILFWLTEAIFEILPPT